MQKQLARRISLSLVVKPLF